MFEGNCFFVSRAATGIYLILKTALADAKNKAVVVPANICYAAILPILYAGFKVRFCDVDAITGNATYSSFVSCCTEDVAGAIVPHMYGNPVGDLRRIAGYCKDKNILLIEDCASAMGAQSDDYPLGRMGDYTVYSTGYSKTIDLGFGGIIVSDNNLDAIKKEEKSLPLMPRESKELALFSKIYRALRYAPADSEFRKKIYAVFPQAVKNELLTRIDDSQRLYLEREVMAHVHVIEERKRDFSVYASYLSWLKESFYPFENGAVPWRFCLLLNKEEKSAVIEKCLRAGLPVSDWYPVVTPIFGEEPLYPGAKEHEEKILNFPLPCDEATIRALAETIHSALLG